MSIFFLLRVLIHIYGHFSLYCYVNNDVMIIYYLLDEEKTC
jgi:hypothetical protein